MQVKIDKPLFLPNVRDIKAALTEKVEHAEEIVFSEPGIDAAGLQLILALKKEFPHVEIKLAPGGPGEIYRRILRRSEGECVIL